MRAAPSMAASDAVTAIDPPGSPSLARATMCLQASRQVKKAPSMFTLITLRQVSMVISENDGEPMPMPALANTASSRPITIAASAMAPTTAASSATSTCCARARTPSASRTPSAAWFSLALRPQTTMSAPASATALAMPRPMPRLPPVTSATLPVRLNGA